MEAKKKYKTPEIEIIILDNEISLALDSTPPVGPEEVLLTPEYLHDDPMKTNMV